MSTSPPTSTTTAMPTPTPATSTATGATAATAGSTPPAPAEPHGQEAPPSAFLRVRIGQEDAHYGGGLVDGARILRLFGDLVTEITIRADGDEGLLTEYARVRFSAPVHPGDYIEARGRLVHRTRLRRVVELEAHKVIAARPGTAPTAAAPLAEPRLVCSATATTVAPVHARPRPGPGDGTESPAGSGLGAGSATADGEAA
jgi:3-aminobutyryl-CoA ammonia-lyase